MGRTRTGQPRFQCGHKGKGRYCHRCDQADSLEKKAAALKTAKKLSKSDQERLNRYKYEANRLRGTNKVDTWEQLQIQKKAEDKKRAQEAAAKKAASIARRQLEMMQREPWE